MVEKICGEIRTRTRGSGAMSERQCGEHNNWPSGVRYVELPSCVQFSIIRHHHSVD